MIVTAALRVSFEVAGSVVVYTPPAVIALPYTNTLAPLSTPATSGGLAGSITLVNYTLDYANTFACRVSMQVIFNVIGTVKSSLKATFDVLEPVAILRRRGVQPITVVTIPGAISAGVLSFIVRSGDLVVAAGAVDLPATSGVELRWDTLHFPAFTIWMGVNGAALQYIGDSTTGVFRHA